MAKRFTLLLGIVLLVVGLWGASTGGHDHELIVFGVNANHNLVHLLSGALAIGAAIGGESIAAYYCLAFGTVYGLVTVLGFMQVHAIIHMLNLNMADNFLHLAISAACLWVGGMSKGK